MRSKGLVVLGFVFSAAAFAQEAAGQASEPGRPLGWMWANFVILAGVLGYFAWKFGGAFFRSRTELIQGGIAEASKLKRDADARAAEMERRLAAVGEEIERLKASAKAEFSAEGRRIEEETSQMVRRIQHHAEQEIAAITKHAREELRVFTAKLALDLAEGQVRSGMTADTDHRLVDGFTHDLGTLHGGGAAA